MPVPLRKGVPAVFATLLATLATTAIADPGPAPASPTRSVQASAGHRPPAPPAYDLLRYREDWSSLLGTAPCDRPDGSDRIKAVQVVPAPCVWVNVGGQARARLESWRNQGLGTIPGVDEWGLLRARTHLDVHVGSHLRLFAEGLWADADGREGGARPVDENQGEVQNLFLEGTGGRPDGLRAGAWAGRRELLFGKQRLVSPADWTNVRRAFQGAGGWITGSGWRVDAFWTRPVLVEPQEGDEWDEKTVFAGAEAHFDLDGGRAVEAYLLYLDRKDAKWLGVTGHERRWTLGVGSWGPIPGTKLDYDSEIAWQFGEFGDRSIHAGMATAELGWKLPAPCWQPRVAVGGDWASGDGDGSGGDVGTYNQLFPTGHSWFGWADLQARQNVLAARLTLTAKPTDRLFLRTDLHQLWRGSVDDAAYAASGAVLRAPGASRARDTATEFDFQAKYALTRHWELELGYAHVWAGAFVASSAAAEDTDFCYAQVTFTF